MTRNPRPTLLDALREHIALTESQTRCDRGQCGAGTAWIEGRRINNSCLTLVMMHLGQTTSHRRAFARR
jgi:xanthine dehydrogenase YagT iron-sulfur-binding subunit